jgi:hypothetical protein
MAKKKSVPKKKSCTKKSCGKRPDKNSPDKNSPEKKQDLPEFEIKRLTKSDYFFGMIKKAFGYE